MLLFFMFLSMSFSAESKIAVVGILGGSRDENVEYKLSVSNPNPTAINVNFTYHEEDLDNVTELHVVNGNEISESTMYLDRKTSATTKIIKKSVTVQALGEAFDMRVFVTRQNYTEGFLPLFKAMLGKEYYVSTFCEFGGFCQFSVTALNMHKTMVYLKIPDSVTEVFFCTGGRPFSSIRDTNFTLKSNEVLLVESPHDLTGTHVIANNNVLVMSGARDLNVSGRVAHLIEQLLPVEQWGQHFIVSSLGINQYGDIFQITSSQPYTRIEMNGYPPIELPESGMTVKRRLDHGMTGSISSNKPIQVIQISGLSHISKQTTDNTSVAPSTHSTGAPGNKSATVAPVVTNINDPSGVTNSTIAPGMSIVPATEHFDTKFYLTCGLKSDPSTFHILSTSDIDDSSNYQSNLDLSKTITKTIPYSEYNLYTLPANDYGIVNHIRSQNNERFGGILQCVDSGGIMPMGLDKKPSPNCTVSQASPGYADGIDNDCDGEADEDYCFGYRCFPHCGYARTENVRSYHQYLSNCEEEVAFYWIRIMDSIVCAHTGPFPDDDCSAAILSANYIGEFRVMELSGLMQDAKFWIDIDRPDCEKLKSDWRCDDAIRNCDDYGTGICSDPDWAVWVNQSCRKYCGLCIPDGHGRKFLITIPAAATESRMTVRNATSQTFQDVAYSSSDQILLKLGSETDEYGRMYDLTLQAVDPQPVVIITDADAVVTVLTRNPSTSIEKTFVVYPVDTLGTEYHVNLPELRGFCDIISEEQNIVVEMATSDGSGTLPALSLGTTTTREVFTADGTVFRASRPFALFCGDDTSGWNQMPSQNSLGKAYIIPDIDPYSAFPLQTAVKVIATSDDTVVEVGNYGIITLLKRGNYATLEYEGGYNLLSNFPLSVGLLVMHTFDASLSAYTILPAVDSFMDYPITISDTNSYVLHVNSAGQTDVLAAKNGYFIPETQAFALTVSLGYDYWAHKTSLMVYPTPSVEFTNFNKKYLCHVTEGTVADNLDNDCDGLIDEDMCYIGYGITREDQDLDGGYGEDCYDEEPGTSSMTPPSAPSCNNVHIVERPEDECWTPCQCDCSWVEQLEYRQTLSPEELEALHNAEIQKYQEDMKLDEDQLSSMVAKKQSAGDERQSSNTIGYTGLVFIVAFFLIIVAVDAIRVYTVLFER